MRSPGPSPHRDGRNSLIGPTGRGRESLDLQSHVTTFAGIGPRRAAALEARGIITAADLVSHLPSRYQDWRTRTAINELKPGSEAVVEGILGRVTERPLRSPRRRRLATGWLVDDRGQRLRLVWFNLPAPVAGGLPIGDRVLARGRISASPDGTVEMIHPNLHRLATGDPPPFRPLYRLPAVVGQKLYSTVVRRILEAMGSWMSGAMPDEIRRGAGLPPVGEALAYLHDPPPEADLDDLLAGKSAAHLALAIDELFAFELAMGVERMRSRRRAGIALRGDGGLSAEMLARLPFDLTKAQQRAIAEIDEDLARPGQMNRMLMGDVGSGKTLVALWAALRTLEAGYQVAMMAPTELLAEQHYRSFKTICPGLAGEAALLTSDLRGETRRSVLDGLSRARIPIVFGTHAIIQEAVRIPSLALAVIDEQHRFGVFDRARMKDLGPRANILMMTATPIPRSLAMSLFGNLDVSFLDEMPKGRRTVATQVFDESDLGTVDKIVREELNLGHRAYYVLPMIDAEDDGAPSVAAMAERLGRGVLAGARIAVLHGRMRTAEKDHAMRRFRDGQVDVLVATTVVEVGIDVPEATVMVVVGAERFGLAQLHQLRGRVGRGRAPSRCCLVVSEGATGRNRIQVMLKNSNGSAVAEADLEIRGPGDVLGSRQSGSLPLRYFGLIHDLSLIEQARSMADRWLERDPGLESRDSAGARAAIHRMLAHGFSLSDVR